MNDGLAICWLAARVERLGWAPVYRAAKVSDHVMRSAVKGKGISKQAAELIRTYVATLAVLLAGCAQTLPALSTGLDGARNVIAVSCPARTPPCETFMAIHNVGVKAYNNALLAEAVGEDASAFEAEGMAALKQLWAALMQVKP